MRHDPFSNITEEQLRKLGTGRIAYTQQRSWGTEIHDADGGTLTVVRNHDEARMVCNFHKLIMVPLH